MEITQQLTPSIKLSRHGKHKNPNYHREYYRQNKEKLLNYSHNYYGIKKTLANLVKENSAKIGVKKISFTGAHNITCSNKYKESFFGKEGKKRRRRTRSEILEETLDRE